jgi:hypothetical protein
MLVYKKYSLLKIWVHGPRSFFTIFKTHQYFCEYWQLLPNPTFILLIKFKYYTLKYVNIIISYFCWASSLEIICFTMFSTKIWRFYILAIFGHNCSAAQSNVEQLKSTAELSMNKLNCLTYEGWGMLVCKKYNFLKIRVHVFYHF